MTEAVIPLDTTTNSTEDTVINNERMLNEFRDLFDPGKSYPTLASLRSEIANFGQKYNVVMSIKNSNFRSVHLWCKHAGVYTKIERKPKKPVSNSNKVVKPRKKSTQRTDCQCFIKAKSINEIWVIERSHGEHNHIIPKNKTVYSAHRRQSEQTKDLILQLLRSGQKVNSILEYLHMIGISNIIKKDIENLQQYFRRADRLTVKREELEGKLPNHQDTSTVATLPIVIPNLVPSDTSNSNSHQHQQFTFVEQKNILY
ncbi:Transcription factor rbf1 (RPG-box-binding factor) (Repressor-activator protein 1) [Mucor circinelloides]